MQEVSADLPGKGLLDPKPICDVAQSGRGPRTQRVQFHTRHRSQCLAVLFAKPTKPDDTVFDHGNAMRAHPKSASRVFLSIADGRLGQWRHVAVCAIYAEMFPVVLKYILPVAGIAVLANTVRWIDFRVSENRTGVGVMAGDTANGEMGGIIKFLELFVMSHEAA